MLIPLLFVFTLLVGLSLIIAATVQLIARQRQARDKAHILKRVADLEEQRQQRVTSNE